MSPRAFHAAYVLHSYDWSESSLILELLTRDEGRVAVAAKGCKRPSSQWRGLLLPFQRLNLAFGRSKSEHGDEILPLRSAEWAGGAALPREAALLAGFYLNELLLKLLARHDPHPALFDAYALTLPALGAADDAVLEAALRTFELLLLREVGLLPELRRVTLTQAVLEPAAHYALRPEAGLVEADIDDDGINAALWRELHELLAAPVGAEQVAALQRACAAARSELKPMLRQLLHYHLGVAQLRSRQVMLELQARSSL